jgi:hypothetical protein
MAFAPLSSTSKLKEGDAGCQWRIAEESKLERLKGNGLRGEKKFAGEGSFGGTAV